MIDIEIIKDESMNHSNNFSDWNNEALIKEVLWALDSCVKRGCSINERYLKALNELNKRLYEVDHPYLIDSLLATQKEKSQSLNGCGFIQKRNVELRKVEEIFKIKTPIADVFLP